MVARFSRLCAVLAAGVLVLTAGCSAGAGTSDGDAGSGETGATTVSLAVGFSAEPATLDFTTTDGAAIPEALLVNVYEGLVKLDGDGEIVPLLAESYEVSDDRRTYTFVLREDVTFTNGAEFTAEDVAFSIERVQSDAWTSSLKSYMDVVDAVEVVSPTEVAVTLARPDNEWLFQMTTRIGAMFSRTGVDDLANTPVGTGPYVVETWTRGDSIVLGRNEDYWGEPPQADEVTLRYFKDPTALTNALRSGGIDVISSVQAPESLAQFEGDDRFQVVEGTTNGELTMALNGDRPALADERVRRAITHAIDRQAIVDTAWAGYGTPVGSMVPPTDPWYEDLTDVHPYDPERAKALLAEAGAQDLSLRFRVPNLPFSVGPAQVVKSQLAEVGITAEIDVLEFPARWLDEVFTKGDFDMSIVAHVEPHDLPTFANPEYYWHYDNPEIAELLTAANTGTQEEQVENMKKAARTLAEDAAAVWLFVVPNLVVAEADVQGIPQNRIGEAFDLTTLSRS